MPSNTYPTAPELAEEAAWFKSTYSGQEGGNCVEVAHLVPTVAVRDSKDKAGPALVLPVASWAAFLAEVRSGRLDHGLVD